MRLALRGPGGLGGLRIEGQLDTDDLSPNLARRVKQLLQPDRLHAVEKSGPGKQTEPDEYYLTLVEEGRAHEFHFQSSDSPVELMTLLNDLMHEVIVRKARVLGK